MSLMSLNDEMFSPDHRLPNSPVLPDTLTFDMQEGRLGLDGVQVNLVNSVDDAQRLMSWLSERRPVLAVDTETTGLSARYDKLRLVQIGDGMTGWSIPWDQWGGVFIDAMSKYEGPITFHNAAFDARFLSVHTPWQVPWHRTHDTMIMAHVIDPTQKVGLKHLADRFVDPRASAGEMLLKKAFHDNKWDWSTVPIEYGPYWEYGALDTVITARLWEGFRADQKYPDVYDLEMDVRRICSRMEDNGAPIDVEYCQKMYDELSVYVDKAKAWFVAEHGVRIGSTIDLVRWLQEKGAVIERTTPKGKPSADKYQLRMLAAEFPLCKDILDVKRADKLAETYFRNFIDKAIDGILHCSIRTLGARTGRMSVVEPGLQTIPKGEATVRNAFIPHKGNVLISCDYSQIEMRLFAHFARSQRMAQAFASDDDFFVTLCRQIYNDPTIAKEDKRRGLTKNVMYGKCYGAGVQKMAETGGVPFDQMKQVVDTFDSTYPDVKRFQQEIDNIAGQRERHEGIAYVHTPFGRRLPADSGRGYTLCNYLLQGHAAELLKRALVRLDNAGLGEALVLPIHDEVIASVPKGDAEEAKRLIVQCMEVTDGSYLVPLTAEAEGPLARWGDKYA
jgi:DNA polymerase-1